MNTERRIFVSLLLFFWASLPIMGQPVDTFSRDFAEVQTWNPYPGQGSNALTGEVSVPSVSIPSFTPAEEYEDSIFGSPLTPVEQGDLYLSSIPSGKRSGVFQKVNFDVLWAPQSGGGNGLGAAQLDLSATFALPLPTADSPFIITPSFETWFFNPKTDGYMTKKTLYSTGLSFRWLKPLVKNKLTVDLGASALYSGDFKAKSSEAMRYPLHVAAIWNCNPRLKIVGGVAYLDREDDLNWFPVVGLIWTPNDDVSVELVAPRLRIAQRVRWFGSAAGDASSDWIYTAFEFGSASWGIEVNDVSQNVDYQDLRLLLGYERRCASGFTFGLETGYMFERKLEWERYNTHPADTVFLRLRTSF